MSSLSHRVGLAVEWFERGIIPDGNGGAGWGWVPDVVPNPQNTAEVVCILARIERPIPREQDVLALIRRRTVHHASGNDWNFSSSIDVAWRLQALRCLVDDPEDPDIVECAKTLVKAHDDEIGGWRMAGQSGPISITATCAALLALNNLDSPGSIEEAMQKEEAMQRGLKMLIGAVLGDDPRADPLFANATIAHLLAQPKIAVLGGKRTERAREKAIGRVLNAMERGCAGVEDEIFTRGQVTDTWRHLRLHLSLAAVAEATPDKIFEPPFRRALKRMLDLQEDSEDIANTVNFGGFRTSEEGFVTSYATTRALSVLAAVETTLDTRVNPALTFDLLCRSDGVHHSDPQDVVTLRGHAVTMNSYAGGLVCLMGLVAASTIIALTIGFKSQLGHAGTGLLLLWSLTFLASGIFVFASASLPRVSNVRIASLTLTGYSAFLAPIIVYIVS
jgi:hypothetical protein